MCVCFNFDKINILYVKVYGGKGMLQGKKILYSVYQQDFDEKNWTPLGIFKSWSLAVTGINLPSYFEFSKVFK